MAGRLSWVSGTPAVSATVSEGTAHLSSRQDQTEILIALSCAVGYDQGRQIKGSFSIVKTVLPLSGHVGDHKVTFSVKGTNPVALASFRTRTYKDGRLIPGYISQT